ncbi:hypothetical protein RKD29_000341 [Streptomyces tendae]|uniref:discoidin domain-containing protein n=1 Tax=Streptomyces tendae TaxID=1932 RepID=UPI003832AF56
MLDALLVQAEVRLRLWDSAGSGENLALKGTATASSGEQDLDRLAAGNVNDGLLGTRWASDYSDDEWVQVEPAAPPKVAAVTLAWEGACATEYAVETSPDGVTWRTGATRRPEACGNERRPARPRRGRAVRPDARCAPEDGLGLLPLRAGRPRNTRPLTDGSPRTPSPSAPGGYAGGVA